MSYIKFKYNVKFLRKFFRLCVYLVYIALVVAFQSGGVYAISQSALDAINNSHPFYVATCSTNNSNSTTDGISGNVIALDPGHSPATPDTPDPATGISNKDYENDPEMNNAYVAATKIKPLLESAGYKVFMTKNSATEKLNLTERANKANNSGASLLVTLHSNRDYGTANNGNNLLMYPDSGSQRPYSDPNKYSGPQRKDNKNNLLHPNIAEPSAAAAVKMAPIINSGIESQINSGSDKTYNAESFASFYDKIGGLGGNGSFKGNTPVQTILSSIPGVYSEVNESVLPTDEFAQAMSKAIKAAVPLNANGTNGAPGASNTSQCCGTGSSSGVGGGTSGGSAAEGGYTVDQVRTFANESINSTWNISDNTVEEWFLNQAGARATIARYGLTSSNIGDITSAIKIGDVSVVWFYAYAVNEGGGAGGFINHYGSDVAGGGVANATRDAKYLFDQSQKMGSKPSWVDVGTNNLNFVPQDIQDAGNTDFQNMPSGTIGRAYIPASAAAAWEVYYPDGLKKEFNKIQTYGSPLVLTMQNIKKMGGDPMEGGVSTSSGNCGNTGGVAGEKMTKGVNWAKMIANNNGYGYDQGRRATGWTNWRSDSACTDQCGSFDCSSFVSAIITEAGYVDTNPNFSTVNEASILEGAGFVKIASSASTSEGLIPGDILIAASHTALYIGDNQIVDATHDENRGKQGGAVGDQTGEELSIKTFNNYTTWTSVYRAQN